MNMDDGRLIAQFQRLITEMLVEKRLGQRRSELTDELYQTWREVQQRGLNKTPEYRNVLLRADQHALWLAGLVRLSSPDAAPPVCTENLIRIDCVTESPNVDGDDRALLPLPDPVRLAVQVEEPTWGRERGAPSST